jgi:hypothetical protein
MAEANSNFPDDGGSVILPFAPPRLGRKRREFRCRPSPGKLPVDEPDFSLPMKSSLLSSGHFSKWFTVAVLTAGLPLARLGAESAPPADQTPSVPIVSTDEMVRKQLEGLDRLLDKNPQLEEALRANTDQIEQAAFRQQTPDWDMYVKQHPDVVRALRVERHYLLHRALARLARRPVFRADMADLDKFLDTHADIGKPVDHRPRLLTETDFLIAHPALAQFFDQHPGLSTALLERADKQKANAAKSGNAKKS